MTRSIFEGYLDLLRERELPEGVTVFSDRVEWTLVIVPMHVMGNVPEKKFGRTPRTERLIWKDGGVVFEVDSEKGLMGIEALKIFDQLTGIFALSDLGLSNL